MAWCWINIIDTSISETSVRECSRWNQETRSLPGANCSTSGRKFYARVYECTRFGINTCTPPTRLVCSSDDHRLVIVRLFFFCFRTLIYGHAQLQRFEQFTCFFNIFFFFYRTTVFECSAERSSITLDRSF